MPRKLEDPEVQVVYQVERQLESIDALDIVHSSLLELTNQYPNDQYHGAIFELASEEIVAERRMHVTALRALKPNSVTQRVVLKLLGTEDMTKAANYASDAIQEIGDAPEKQLEREAAAKEVEMRLKRLK